MSIVRQRISFQHQAPIRKTNVFSTCSYICSYSHLLLHNRRILVEIAYQITQVLRVFDTQFLPFYTTCAIQCTCRKPNRGSCHLATKAYPNMLRIQKKSSGNYTNTTCDSTLKNEFLWGYGKFLGFMITHQGIEANPDKCTAILEMHIPTNIQEVQKLNSRLATLSRFLPKLVEKAKPFYKLLKRTDPSNGTRLANKPFCLSRRPQPYHQF